MESPEHASLSSDRSEQSLGVHEGDRRLRWRRPFGFGAVTDGGLQGGTKFREGSRVYRKDKWALMSRKPSPPRAISLTGTSPVTWQEAGAVAVGRIHLAATAGTSRDSVERGEDLDLSLERRRRRDEPQHGRDLRSRH